MNHPAHFPVLYQNYELLRKYQAKLNELDPVQRSPLHLACFYGTKPPKLKIAEEEIAFKFNNKELIQEDTHTKRVMDFLMSNMIADPYQTDKLFGWTLYDCAFSILNLYVIQKLLKQLSQTCAIVLEKFKNLKEDFFTVVYYSLKFGYNDLFRLMSEIPYFKKALSMENCNGESLLYLAVKCGNHDNVEELLDNGAKANTIVSTYNKRSVLHFAVENGHNEVVRLLLDRGAFPDIMDRYRSTPLHIDSSKVIYQSAQLLLNYGSDVNFADNFGRTSLQLAATC
ncbi:hypothetical protein Zmor_018439 [Zophobas morio]|uniref:Uncharacterized protein n=1 Tax=Zophobas morio TaxID=2755281 RepID=A0AA38MDI7_9CUCU|nr:hypothetical protein Zmor_018439 [Zophobas morio]